LPQLAQQLGQLAQQLGQLEPEVSQQLVQEELPPRPELLLGPLVLQELNQRPRRQSQARRQLPPSRPLEP
jgi:hypothetical protein